LGRSRRSPSEKDSWTPPAGREDPRGIGVEQAPDEDDRGNEKEPKHLVAPECAALLDTASLLLGLLLVRLDAGLNHGYSC